MKNKYNNLIKNTFIFTLGTFGSKILTFLIVPFYTYVLSTADYGKIDLITSTISLMIPFITLLIYEAAIRFLIGKELDKSVVFNNCIATFFIGNLLLIVLSPILLRLLGLIEYFNVFLILTILTSYTTIFGQYLRAIGDNWSFSISGLINTLFTVTLNLIFVLLLKRGIIGYLYSMIIAQIITAIFIFIKCHTIKCINFKMINFNALKKMLIYSLPLVPNNLMWWVMNAGDKYVINYFLGPSYNGIFSISYKIPTILSMLFSIFMQAWQVSAIEERGDKSRNNFYKNVFDFISISLVICTALIIIFVKPVFEMFIGSDFVESWKYVPLLCVATLFNCFSTFAGVVYIVEKNSKKSFITTFVGAISNLVLNFMLIKSMGLLGVAIGTAIGYLFVLIFRFNDYKKYFGINLVNIKFVLINAILILDSLLYMSINSYFKYAISLLSLILIFIVCKKEIGNLFTNIKNMIKKRLKKKIA